MPQTTSAIEATVKFRSILLATDLSPASQRPLRHAISIARYYGATLYITYVVSALGFTMCGPEAVRLAIEASGRDMANLEQELSRSGLLDGVQCRFIVCDGNIRTELEEIVRRNRIDLVIVGAHQRNGIERMLVGSTAERISRHSSCPVLAVGPHASADWEPQAPGVDRPLLFATAFDSTSVKAFPYAASLANQLKRRLVLLHVISRPPRFAIHRHPSSDFAREQSAAQADAVQRIERMTATAPWLNIKPAIMVEFGEPAAKIVQVAHALNAEATILGTRRHPGIAGTSHLPWLTAYTLIRCARCPILTV
jgi:nucleotide-binding universal stress UspA family protein